MNTAEGIENMEVFVKRPGMALQRPAEVFTHLPAAGNKHQLSYGIQQTSQTPNPPNETNQKDI